MCALLQNPYTLYGLDIPIHSFNGVFFGHHLIPIPRDTKVLIHQFQSPYWLISKGRVEDARQALATLRGHGTEVDGELESIQMGLEQQPSFTLKDQVGSVILRDAISSAK